MIAAVSPTRTYAGYPRHGFRLEHRATAEELADVIVFTASPRAH